MRNPSGLDAKQYLSRQVLTLAELESTTSLGTTGLLTLYLTAIAGHEAFSTKCLLVISVDLHQGTGNSQTKCL